MEPLQFKTTIKCSGCVATVTPFLNEAAGEGNWQVDLENPSRVLTVKGNPDREQIVQAIETAGYKAEVI